MSIFLRINEGVYDNKRRFALNQGTKEERAAFRAAYDSESARLLGEFRRDLYIEHGVTGNPKADKAFGIAWEHGHSSGYSEVAAYFADLVPLITP